MKIMQFIAPVFFVVAAVSSDSLFAMHDSGNQDPLINMAYRDAFDQHEIHPEYADLLRQWGCAANVFGAADAAELHITNPSDRELLPIPPLMQKGAFESSKDFAQRNGGRAEAYEKACSAKLNRARRWTLAEPMVENGIHSGLSIAAGVISARYLGKESLGGGYGALSAIFNGVHSLNPCIRSCWHLAYPPSRELDELELSFAKNQCFIPRGLWNRIITEFMIARTSSLTLDKHLNFLEFALDLTLYKPRAALKVKEGYTFEAAIRELLSRIDSFIETNYKPVNDTKGIQSLENLKAQIFDFLIALANEKNAQSIFHYLYLKGPYGIGKTYFINELCQWLDELFPESIQQKILANIESPAQLQGNKDNPGIILDVLRNQLKNGRRGSLIFIDEATWLNDKGMAGTCRTVFNGDQFKLSTAYLGDDIDIERIPPMLIIVAANDPLENPALASRFIQVQCPEPKPAALVAYACKCAATSKYLDFTHTPIDTASIDRWIQTAQPVQQLPAKTTDKASKQPDDQKSTTAASSPQTENNSKNQGITNFRDAKNGVDAFCRALYLSHEKKQ